MATLIRTKRAKKQPAFSPSSAGQSPASQSNDIQLTQQLEEAVLDLESAVLGVLESEREPDAFRDVDYLFWSRQLKSIAAQISLALSEYEGLRRFHYHYRQDADNEDELTPVAGPEPVLLLVRVCREALTQCSEMVGMQCDQVLFRRARLEKAIRQFLHRWQYAIGSH